LELQLIKGLLMNPPGRLFCRRIIEARAKTFHNSSSMSGGARELEDVGHMKCSLKASFSNHPFLLIKYKNIFLRRMDVSPGGD
jgi:hypothetical protein